MHKLQKKPQIMTDKTQTLAQFCAAMPSVSLDPAVTERAKLIIADCVAAILGGIVETEVKQLVEQRSGEPCATRKIPLIGPAAFADRAQAAFIHGLAGTVLEMDEGHQFAKGHPGIHVFPALLAAAQSELLQQPVSGREFITAFVTGYDIAARIGNAARIRPSMHPHGTWGVMGAASAIGTLLHYNSEQHCELLNIASSLTTASSRKTMLEGGTVRNAYAGLSNQMGHLAIDLLQSGFSGERDGIGSVFGAVISDGLDPDLLTEELGQRFEVMRNYFKLHACCRYNHAALDCLVALMEAHPELADSDTIEAIDVVSYNLAAELDDPRPRNMLAAKFSIPFAMATTLVHKNSKVMSFAGAALSNQATAKLAEKVTVTEDPAMTALLPDFRPAQVTIKQKNGKSFSHSVKTNRGDWQDPYSAEELKEKFYSLAERSLSPEQSATLYDGLMKLDSAPDVSAVFRLS